MRTFMAVVAAVVLAFMAGCSSDDTNGNQAAAETGEEIDVRDLPEWLRPYAVNDLEEAPEDGVWLDRNIRTVFVADCERMEELTAEGGPYGPSDGETGWAGVCQG